MNSLTSELLEPDVQQLVEAVAKEAGFSNPTFGIAPGSKKGDNFIGVLKRVIVEDEQHAPMSVIVKSQPKNEALRIEFGIEAFFSSEARFYNIILPAFIKFQKENGVTDGFAPSAPKCYHASTTAIILEDMMPHGYVMLNKKEDLDFRHCADVVRELGRFHAVSFAMKDQKPQLFREITKDLKEAFITENRSPHMALLYDKAVKNAVDMFKQKAVVEDKERYERVFEKFTIDYHKTLLQQVNPKSAEPYSVINHGDVWDNNMLYKYGKDDKQPTGLCLVDFQLVRNSSPVTDLSYFLFCCTRKAFRDEHYDCLLAEYYGALTAYIRVLGSDPEKVFPLEAFHDQLKNFSKYGLGLGVFDIPIITSDSGDKPEGGSDAVKELSDDTDTLQSSLEKNFNISHSSEEELWSRINGVIIDMVDKGYIV